MTKINQDDDMYDLDISKNKQKRKDLISNLKAMEDDNYVTNSGLDASSFLPSSLLKSNKDEEEDKINKEADDWFNELMGVGEAKVSKSGKRKNNDIFSYEYNSKKKKKKKKKDKQDLVDYKKEFEPEMALYKNLMVEQNKFTNSLQSEYDKITSVKGSSRGITKQLTDLMDNITKARALAVQLVEKNVNTKKLIADLTIKQKKELGDNNDDGTNITDFASTYLKKMLDERSSILSNSFSDPTVAEYEDTESLFNDLSLSLGEDTRDEEVSKYLEYENRNVTINVVIVDDDIENYEFIAKDEDGEIIDDYPLPYKTKISVNRSTNVATDAYGKKYFIEWK